MLRLVNQQHIIIAFFNFSMRTTCIFTRCWGGLEWAFTLPIIFRWKVQVASKGVYFRKPKVSLIPRIKSSAVLCLLGNMLLFSLGVLGGVAHRHTFSSKHKNTHCMSSSGFVHEQLLLCGAWCSDGTQLPRTPRENALLLLQPHHQQGHLNT